MKNVRKRGSALVIIVLISLIISGLIMTLAWAAGAQAETGGMLVHDDEAYYAADAALQWALFNYKASPTWPSNTLGSAGTTIKVGPTSATAWSCLITYTDMGPSIGMATGVLGNPLQFKCVATRSGLSTRGVVLAMATGVMSYAPQFWVASDLAVAQSATIKGDVQTMGNLTINKPTSGNVVNKGAQGEWKAKGTITDNNPSGDSTYFTSQPAGNSTSVSSPSMTASKMYQTMMSGSTVQLTSILYTNSSTGHYVIDFSKAGGKPVVLSGNATYNGNVDIVQSSTPANDTFIVNGNCTFTGTFPANASVAKMNLVVNGDVNFNGSGTGINITGSFYSVGNYTQQGVYAFNGIVMSDKTATIAGTGSIGVSAPPSFDPRYTPKFTAYISDLP